jgi:hypothetical protein
MLDARRIRRYGRRITRYSGDANMRTLALAVLLLTPGISSAQIDSVRREPSRLCWRGKPAPVCHTFWLTEVSGEYAFATTQTTYTYNYSSGNNYTVRRPDVSSRLVWTVGPMFNRGPTHALGGTISAGFVNDGSRIAVEARRRRWLNPPDAGALDLSAGVVRLNVPAFPGSSNHETYGLTGGAYFIGGDLVHVTAHGDLLLTGGRVRAGTTVGAGLGSYATAVATIVLAALTIAAIAAFANSDF